MTFIIESRPTQLPLVDEIWHARSAEAGSFFSIAAAHWQMVVTRRPEDGSISMTVRGPETRATPLKYPENVEWMGIRFALGSTLSHLPIRSLVDRDQVLPAAGDRSFWLNGSAWSYPTFDNADSFVDRLLAEQLLVINPDLEIALQSQLAWMAPRSTQRWIRQLTGLNRRTVHQIRRARQAMLFLQQGLSILDTVHQAGYYDQAHLTRSLKRWVGQSPTQIAGLRQV